MDWTYIFNTSTRHEYGLFYLDLIKAFETSLFVDPNDVPIIAMCGSHGKSMAADVMFHSLLKGRDPMQVIDGKPVRHMYLEDKPKDAIHGELFDHGHIELDHSSELPISLMFINQPMLDPYDRHSYDDNDDLLAQSLRKAFRRGAKGGNGGLIFASSYASFANPLITVSTDGGIDNGWRLENHNWEKEHTVFVNSKKLQESEQFQEGWKNLISSYPSRNAITCNY